jgi:hypothetical protein
MVLLFQRLGSGTTMVWVLNCSYVGSYGDRLKTVLLFQRLDSDTTMVRVLNGTTMVWVTNGSYVELFEDGATISTTRLGCYDGSGDEWKLCGVVWR